MLTCRRWFNSCSRQQKPTVEIKNVVLCIDALVSLNSEQRYRQNSPFAGDLSSIPALEKALTKVFSPSYVLLELTYLRGGQLSG